MRVRECHPKAQASVAAHTALYMSHNLAGLISCINWHTNRYTLSCNKSLTRRQQVSGHRRQ